MLFEVLINDANIDIMQPLIPDPYIADLKDNLLYGVAVYDDFITVDRLVGVVLFDVSGHWQKIVWIHLTKPYSMPCYGADILRMRVCAAENIGRLFGTYSMFFSDLPVLEEYYHKAGFSVEDAKSDVFYYRIDQVKQEKLDIKYDNHVKSVSELSLLEKETVIDLLNKSKMPLPIENKLIWSDFEQTVSCVYMDNDRIAAILLCEVTEDDEFTINLLFSESNRYILSLFGYAYDKIIEGYGKSTIISLSVFSPSTAKLLMRICPDVKRYDMKKAIFLHKPKSKNVFVDQLIGKINASSASTDNELLALSQSAFWMYEGSDGPVSDMYAEEKKKSDRLFSWLGLDSAVVPNHTIGRHEPPISAVGKSFRGDRFRESHLRRRRALSVRNAMKKETFVDDQNYHLFCVTALNLLKENKAKLRTLDGNEFIVHPESFADGTTIPTILADTLFTLQHRKANAPALDKKALSYEKAEYKYETKLTAILDKMATTYFGSAGLTLTGDKISKKKQQDYRNDMPHVLFDYRDLVIYKDKYVLGLTGKQIEKSPSIIKKIDEFRNQAGDKLKLLIKNDEDEYVNHGTDEKANTMILRVLDERKKIRANILRIESLFDLKEGFKKVEDIHRAYSDEKKVLEFLLSQNELFLNYLINKETISGLDTFYIQKRYGLPLAVIDQDAPLETGIQSMTDDFDELADWDFDYVRVPQAYTSFLYRTDNYDKLKRTIYLSVDEIKTAYDRLCAMIKENRLLTESIAFSVMFSNIPEMIEMFALSRDIRESIYKLPDISEGMEDILKETEAVYLCLLRRNVLISILSVTGSTAIAKLQIDWDSTSLEYTRELLSLK